MADLLRVISVIVLTQAVSLAQTAGSGIPDAPKMSTTVSVSQLEIPEASEPLLASTATPIEQSLMRAESGGSLLHAAMVRPVAEKPTVSKRQRETLYALMAAEHGAALFDAWSTRQALRQGGRELDPLVRPFAHSAVLYPALQVAPLAADYLASKLIRSHHPVLRKLWWVPQTVTTAGSLYCGATNLAGI